MALNIKNPEVEALVEQVVGLTGESKTEAVRQALAERVERLSTSMFIPLTKKGRFFAFLEEEVWPFIPEDQRGKTMTKEEQEELLGFGELGV